jgi:hypothetical protein
MGRTKSLSTKSFKVSNSNSLSSVASSLNGTRRTRNIVNMNKYFLGKPTFSTNPFSFQASPKIKSNSEIISSFAGAFIRNWIREQQKENMTKKYNFYEFSYLNGKNKIVDVNGKDTKLDLSKDTIIIIKVKNPAPVEHYPNHWYFKTPDSQLDSNEILLPTGWHSKKDLKYTNSYTLDWQLVSTNQFCMIYAFYGIIVPIKDQKLLLVDNRKYVDDERIKQIFDTEEKNRQSLYNGLDFKNQDKNTSTILTFFLQFITTYIGSSLMTKSIKDGSDAYKKNHKKSYELRDVFNQIQDGISHPHYHRPQW